jgi:hypothetical protein
VDEAVTGGGCGAQAPVPTTRRPADLFRRGCGKLCPLITWNWNRPTCPYGFSKTPTEFLSTERKTNSFGSVKLRSVFPQARRVLPFTRGFPTANPIWAGGSPTDQTIPPVDQGVLGGSNRGKSHFLSSGHPLPSNNSGRMSGCGKYFPLASSPFGYPPRGPSNHISSICFI